MARTPSNMLALGTLSSTFTLWDATSQKTKSFEEVKGTKGTVVFFICNHCPFVHHVIEEVVRIVNDYRVQGIGFIAISSNDVSQYPQDAPELMVDF
ncbi:MAG TPA: redoxin domain-containing protein, partial [Flavobacterium sp.]|nr:redoxin domain-containing protein [Flavobacterium sp.]